VLDGSSCETYDFFRPAFSEPVQQERRVLAETINILRGKARSGTTRVSRSVDQEPVHLFLDQFLGLSEMSETYAGTLQDVRLVAKFARAGFEEDLRHEASVYAMLSDLYGTAIPPCFGLFEGEFTVLLTMDMGRSPAQWGSLPLPTRCVL
jgi:hypothetical protein